MPINIYISSNGKSNPNQTLAENNNVANQQSNELNQNENNPVATNSPAEVGLIANSKKFLSSATAVMAIGASALALSQKIASKTIDQYADFTGDVMGANRMKIDMSFDIINVFKISENTYNYIRTLQKEKARVDFLKERSGNSVLNGSRGND